MHCGRSLARVGLDFRQPLAAVVARAAHGLFRSHVARALAMLSSSLDMHKWAAMPAARVAALEVGSGGGAASAALSEATPLLMQHPPLAVFVNAVRCPSAFPRCSPPFPHQSPLHRLGVRHVHMPRRYGVTDTVPWMLRVSRPLTLGGDPD